jgi:NADH dehydrogenase [ubiquinone] 1 alpha subcomplex assembly factor 5
MNSIFCHSKLLFHRNRAIKFFLKYDYLFDHSAKNILDRVRLYKDQFKNIIEVGSRSCLLSEQIQIFYPNSDITICDHSNELLNFSKNKFKKYLIENQLIFLEPAKYNLLISSLYLHWVNDIHIFLENARQLLAHKGIAILSFIGGNSLNNLRKFFIKNELELRLPVTAHISPFLTQEAILKICKNMNIRDVVVDSEIIEVEYQNCYQLMKELNLMGESSCIKSAENYAICKELLVLAKNLTQFTDRFEIIYLMFLRKQ